MPYWIRPTTRALLMQRAERVATREARPLCVYASISDCDGVHSLEHVTPRIQWKRLSAAAEGGSLTAARELARLVRVYGGMNDRRNLVVACSKHNRARSYLPLDQFAPPYVISLIDSERIAPLKVA